MRVLPALKAVTTFALGITLAYWLPLSFSSALLLSLILLFLSLLPLPDAFKQIAVYGALVVAGASSYLSFEIQVIPNSTKLYVLCRVEEPPLIRDGFYSFPAHVIKAGPDSANMGEFDQQIWVKGRGDFQPQLGAELLLKGELKPFREKRNPGDFDLKRWRAGDGVIGEFACISMQEVSGLNTFSLIMSARKWLSNSCDQLALQDASLWKGLLLGFRRDIDPTLTEDLRITGLTHLLALSGLNVGFLALAFIGFGSIIRLPLYTRMTMALVLVVTYSQIIPDRGSTLRATVMTVAILLGYLFRRWTPSLNTIGFAGLFILAFRPLDLFDPGFQLSFAATSGIFLFEKDISNLNNWRRSNSGKTVRFIRHWIFVPFAISIASSTFAAPLTSFLFTSIPLAGPIFNLVAVPLFGVVYAGAWMAVLSQPISSWFSQLIADGVSTISLIWQEITHLMAQIAPEWRITLPPWSIVLIFGMLIWAGVSRRALIYRYLILSCGVATVLIFATIKVDSSNFRALFIDVGHGDAQVWLFPDGVTCLIDAGPIPNNSEKRVDKILHRLNRSNLSLIVASHPDADHIGGFNSILKEFDVENAITNYSSKSTETFRTLIENSTQKSVVWRQLSEGDTIFGLPDGYGVQILNPPSQNSGLSDNDLSLVLRLAIPVGFNKKLYLLTTGDIEVTTETSLKNKYYLESGLLKIPHHGSPTSSSEDFIKAVAPKYGIISRGWGDERVGAIARQAVLNRYKSVDVELLYTDKEGAILMEATPEGWRSVDWRRPPFLRWLIGEF